MLLPRVALVALALPPPSLRHSLPAAPFPLSYRRATRLFAAASFYDVLGVEASASSSEVKRAYRRKALEFHPDVNPDPAARDQFVRVTEAYETLFDADKRGVYDRKLRMERAGGSSRSRTYGGDPRRSTRASNPRRDPTRNYDAWRAANPTADMIDDSFTSIFSDLFREGGAGVNGFFSDLVDYLETGVGDPSTTEFRDFVRSGATAEIEEEAATSAKLIAQLQTKLREVQREERQAGADLRSHKATMRGEAYRFRMADLDREADLEERVEGLRKRIKVMEKHLSQARKRDDLAREELQGRKTGGRSAGGGTGGRRSWGDAGSGSRDGFRQTASRASSASSSGGASSRPPPQPRQDKARLRQSVEDELKRMKKDMGKDK